MSNDDQRIPPSFTPSGGPSDRPSGAGDAIPVGGTSRPPAPPTGGRVGRRDDAAPVEPRVRRQSSREIPTTPPERRGGGQQKPRSYSPRGSSQSSPASRPAQSRQGSGTRVMPASAQGQARRTPPPGRTGGAAAATAGGGGFRVRKGRVAGLVLVLLLVLLLAWPIGLVVWANGKIQHVDALSDAKGTPGTTYLLAGSDARGSGSVADDGTEGARTDTIMVLHKPRSGPASLISIPRDTYTEIPGHDPNKINAAYSFGGAPLLVQTVEGLTGLTIDHYAEVGFGSVEEIVDAVGGVELCYDDDVDDPKSGMEWEAGCHLADGETALAFSRMRYSDPKGDIGRAERQQQVIAAVAAKVVKPSVLLNPVNQVQLVNAGTDALTVDEKTGIVDLGRLGLAFKAATGPEGVTGTPPIADPGYDPGTGVGSTVLLDEDKVDQFWADVRDGELKPGATVGGMPG
ncbi:LCP family protein [Krasilnikoviella flava]|uniref:Transcriptional attenuator, LytR family n=1 Tax=Krasilnikoviella flava TaxID=526729 RepID=A0A1T5IB61_9MICO|nr:LCP family protein [Krasilnikoviella flava]SKC36293.1 transcriptional attenuator, LytR family [Krasilnikoviella flava]